MITHTDTRTVFHIFFRQLRKFLLIFLPVTLAGVLYVLLATPGYESTANLLVKFGQDARPDISNQPPKPDNSSADEHHELVQSNVDILTSRDLAEAMLKDITLQRAYPRLVDDPPSRGTLMDAAIKQFTEDLVIKTENDSDIIHVGLYNPDPQTARAMLHRLIDLFFARQTEVYANPQTAVLREQAETAHRKLQDDQKQLDEYKSKLGIVSIDEELTLLLQQRSDLFDDVQQKIDDLRAREAELSQTYKADSEVMINLRKSLQKAEAENMRRKQAMVHSDAPAKKGDGSQMVGLDQQISDLEQRKARHDDLMREIAIDEDNYKAAQTRAQEAVANQGLNQQKITRISVIEQPTLPYKATRPWKAVVLALSLLIALTLGFAACIIAESFDQRITLPQQAVAVLGVPVIASFPYRFPDAAPAQKPSGKASGKRRTS